MKKSEKVVCNASPIILLSKISALDILEKLFDEIIIPSGVEKEITVKPSKEIIRFIRSKKVKVVKVKSVSEVLKWGLGKGESQVVSFAIKNKGYTVILDDKLGRKCAKFFKIPVRGTIGVIIYAKKKKKIRKAKTYIKKLFEAGIYFPEKWISEILSLVNEKWD